MLSIFRTCLIATIMLILVSSQSFSQSKEIYFKDTITRSFSLLKGSFDEDKMFVYSYGVGIGKYSHKQPLVFKIDANGNEVWNTGQDTLFNFDGTIFNAFLEGNFIYTFGSRDSDPYGFFLSIIDKQSGKVTGLSHNYAVNSKGITDVRPFGTDSIRVVYYTYTANYSPSNIPPIYFLNFHKNTGIASTPKLYGLSDLSPLLIDQDDNAYYYTAEDTLIKYSVPAATISWKNYTLLPGSFITRPGTNLVKDAGMVYLFGDRYERGIDDASGKTSWNIFVPSRTLENFYPHQIEIKADTIYTGWDHPYSGSVTEYGHFSKVNKKTGFTYLNGTITDTGGIDYNADGYFRSPNFSVADNGEIYLMGYSVANNTQGRIFKYLSSSGKLLSQTVLPPDSVSFKQYNLVGEPYNSLIKPYIFNNEPFFIYDYTITSSKATTTRSKYSRFSPAGQLADTHVYDHNYYMYPSRTVDMQKFGNYMYVVKQQGAAAFLEKYSAGMELIWQKQVSECFVYPHAFAIDSAENICIAGQSYNCEIYSLPPGNVYYPAVNFFVIIDKNGQIRRESRSDYVSLGQPFDLLGANDNFYFINSNKWFTIDAVNGVSAPVSYGQTNSSSGIFKGVSDNLFLSINGKDSIYVFSSRLQTSDPAFYIALPKNGGSKRIETLKTWFENGYLFNVTSSKLDPNVAYVCGLTGIGATPTIIKYNYVTKTTYWKFSGPTIGEAFKVVEDPAGYLYAMLRVIDSTQILKLNSIDGGVVWKYSLKETDSRTSRVDLDYSSSTNTVVAAGNSNSTLSGPYYVVLNAETGSLIKVKTLEAGYKEEKNYIEAVEAIPGSAIAICGNINAERLGGNNGFILVEGKLEIPKVCNIKAAFITIKDTGTAGKYNFTNLSQPDTAGVIYTWKFSQVDSIGTKNASYTFTQSGTYTVSLTARQGNTCISIADTVIEVNIDQSCQLNPTFTVKQDDADPNRIYFTNLSQSGPATKYLWDFGDGSVNDTLVNPAHTYTSSGNYLVCLQSTLNSCVNRSCVPVSVQNPSEELIAYPNPATDEITLAFSSRSASVYTVNILTFGGAIVSKTSIEATVGNNAIPISLKNLKAGLYVIELNNGDQRFSILIQKI